MKIMLATAAEPVYSVDKLPKGSKVIGYEVYRQGTKTLLGKGAAGTAKQAIKRIDFHANTGMTVDLAIIAMDGEHKISLTEAYKLKDTGAVKA